MGTCIKIMTQNDMNALQSINSQWDCGVTTKALLPKANSPSTIQFKIIHITKWIIAIAMKLCHWKDHTVGMVVRLENIYCNKWQCGYCSDSKRNTVSCTVAWLAILDEYTPTFDCFIRVTQINLTALIECFTDCSMCTIFKTIKCYV